jgi:adenylate cyclase
MGNLILGSPLAAAIMLRGCARCCLGDPRWRDDVEQSATMARAIDVTLRAMLLVFKYSVAVNGAWLPDAADSHETAEVLEIAERSGHDFTLSCARYVHGFTLLMQGGPQRDDGIALLATAREAAVQERSTMGISAFIDTQVANEKIRVGDLDGAIELSRAAIEAEYASGEVIVRAATVAALVDALLRRGRPADLQEALAAVQRLAAVPTEPGFVINDIWLLRLRAMLAQARGDASAYRDYRDRYRAMANSLGFEGHMQWAEAMS